MFIKENKRPSHGIKRLCLVLACVTVLVPLFGIGAQVAADETVINTSVLSDESDIKVAVGLYFGDSVVPEFQITSGTGFEVGIQKLKGDKEYEKVWDIYNNVISATSDANLKLEGNDYLLTNEYNSTLIGAYHVQIDCDDMSREEFEAYMTLLRSVYEPQGLVVVPCYIYTGYAARIGDFASWEQAYPYYTAMLETVVGRKVSLITPSYTAVSVIDPWNAKILFEYDCGGESVIGFRANPDENGNTYLKTPSGTVYDGVFAFRRQVDGIHDGVSLINVLPIEAYIAGVLPYEISNSWPIEVQKEFAIAARSFTLTHLGTSKHSSYGFDLCNTDCCEVYKGAGRINEAVMEAVLGTKGIVISYDGGIVTSYYSSTVGGVTVSSADCWGGAEVPYLQAIETPWEDYMNHSNGFWINEVSPYQLLERLNKAGYNELQGGIADLEIEELAKNSTYVKKLKVTDIYGTSVTITYTDKVRTSLTPYVNSANFVVGRGSVEYTEETPSFVGSGVQAAAISGTQLDKSEGFTETDELYILTSDSYDKIDYVGEVRIMTSKGEIECTKHTLFTVSKQTAEAYIGTEEFDKIRDEVESSSSTGGVEQHTTETVRSDSGLTTKIAYAEDANNFIFVGKGWGHGVGMSQWGAYDLAENGYTYDAIIKAYFPTIDLVNYWTTKNYKDKRTAE